MIYRSVYLFVIMILAGCSSQRKDPPAPVVYGVEHKGAEKEPFSKPLSSSMDPPVEMVPELQEGQIVVVEAHDTLDSIAERYQVDRKTIIHQNQLMSPYYLFPGQNLKLPADAYSRPIPLKKMLSSTQKTTEFIEDDNSKEEHSLKSEKLSIQKRKGRTIEEREKELEEQFSHLEANLKPSSAPSKKQGVQEEEQEKVLPLKKPFALKSKSKILPSEDIEKSIDSQTPVLEKAQTPENSPSNDKESLKEEETKDDKFSNLQHSSANTTQGKTLKFKSPLKGNFRDHILSDFSQKEGRVKNDGLNIAAPQNTPVMAAEKGKVIYAGNEVSGFGNLVLLKHEGGWMTAYGHCAEIRVKPEQMVQQGEVIALVGNTGGGMNETQLHFQIRKFDPKEKKPIVVDPKLYLE